MGAVGRLVIQAWQVAREWLADCWPIIARAPCGWALGWVERFPGGRVGHLDVFIVRQRRGTVTGLRCVRDAWVAACRRRRVVMMTTRIRKTRLDVLILMRRDGWREYGEDHRDVWFRKPVAGWREYEG